MDGSLGGRFAHFELPDALGSGYGDLDGDGARSNCVVLCIGNFRIGFLGTKWPSFLKLESDVIGVKGEGGQDESGESDSSGSGSFFPPLSDWSVSSSTRCGGLPLLITAKLSTDESLTKCTSQAVISLPVPTSSSR